MKSKLSWMVLSFMLLTSCTKQNLIDIKDLRCRDPFFIKEESTYYLVASRGEVEKHGFVLYKTNDLKHFEQPKTIFEETPDFWAHQNYWAPEIHKYKDKYYLFASLKNPDHVRGTQIFVSDMIDGDYRPLTEGPVTPSDWECLDGTLYVENGIPYIVFCHEWLQVKVGEICALQLSDDLTHSIGDPIILFKASEAPWVRPFRDDNYITDGPFIKKQGDHLIMIWSSMGDEGYAMGIATSDNIRGPWEHNPIPFYSKDGGHGMIFNNGEKDVVAIHCPNGPDGEERIRFLPFDGDKY